MKHFKLYFLEKKLIGFFIFLFLVLIICFSCDTGMEKSVNFGLDKISIKPSSAKIGDYVDISGSAFDYNQTIFFDTIPSYPVAIWLGDGVKNVTVEVPFGAKTCKVFVLFKGEKSNEVDFTVLP